MKKPQQNSEEGWRKFLDLYIVFKIGLVITFVTVLYQHVNKSSSEKEADVASVQSP